VFFTLWLRDIPALLKGFLGQIVRPGFAFTLEVGSPFGREGLTGRSVRVVVTMGMPALIYCWYFRAHSVKSLECNILIFVGVAPLHETPVASVGQLGDEGVDRSKARMRGAGGKAG